MAGQQDFVVFFDDFITGAAIPTTSATAGTPWVLDDTSSSGAPTIAFTTPSNTGEIKLTMSSTNEATNLGLAFGDVLPVSVTKLRKFEARVKISAVLSAVETWCIGVVGAQSDTITTMTGALVHITGDAASNKLICRTKSSTVTKTETTTVAIAADTWFTVKIDFSNWSDVKFYAGTDGNLNRIAKATTFDLSTLTGSLQPIVQIAKASGTTTTSTSADYVLMEATR
jgi:hypothetical protein